MRAIVIGAGRGQRLMPTTKNAPKCYAEVAGRRILDWIVEAFAENGVDDIVFIGGYLMEKVQAEYPGFTFRPNEEWPDNNILASLMCAEDLMDRPFFTTYADILYRPDAVSSLIECSGRVAVTRVSGRNASSARCTRNAPTESCVNTSIRISAQWACSRRTA